MCHHLPYSLLTIEIVFSATAQMPQSKGVAFFLGHSYTGMTRRSSVPVQRTTPTQTACLHGFSFQVFRPGLGYRSQCRLTVLRQRKVRVKCLSERNNDANRESNQ